jgi:hypothetical protein
LTTLSGIMKAAEQSLELRNRVLTGAAEQVAVAHELAAFMAKAAALQAAVEATMGPQLASIRNLQNQIAVMTSPYAAYGESIRALVEELIQPVALASVSEFASRALAMGKAGREYDAALAKMGWWFPMSMSSAAFWEIGKLAASGKRVAVRQEMTKLVRGVKARRLAESWMDVETFNSRRRFIIDGVRDHQAGRYRVSIPTLLPLIEGITIEEFKPNSRDANPKKALAIANAMASEVWLDSAIVDTATFLYGDMDFSTARATSRRLNRHFVLHGRSTGYGTEANSAQVLFTLDQVHALVLAKQKAQGQKAS